MKHFKKIIFTLVLLVAGLVVLTACTKVDLEAAKEALEIGYEAGETSSTVKTKVTLPTTIEGFKGVTVTWASDNTSIITVAGVVTRPDVDTLVTLTATLSLKGQDSVTKPFIVTVLAKEVAVTEVTFTVTVPEGTDKVFIVGSMNEWSVDTAEELTKGSDGKFSIKLSLAAATYDYKYISGRSWDDVEKDADGEEIENRQVVVGTTAVSVDDVVETWASAQVDDSLLKSLLDEHYKDSIAIPNFLVETTSLDLVSEIGGLDVTWSSNNEEVINSTTGAVNPPAYTGVNEVFIVLTAKATGQKNVNYVVKVAELPQTLDQKLEAELNRLTNFPSSTKPILKADLGLENLVDVIIDGAVVTQATWTSSEPEFLTHEGKLTEAEFEGDKDVVVSVTFTYEGITKSKDLTFTIRGVRLFSGFLEMLEGSDKGAKGDMVKITDGVSFYASTNDGYYLIDKDGILLFVYGTSGKPAAGKLFTPKFELDLYYASPQAKSITYVEVEGGTPHTEASITEITLEDLVKKPTPSDDAPLVHRLYKVTGAKLHTYDLSDNYMTYLVPQSHDDPTKQPNKSDSMMLYYQTPGGVARLQQFAPLNQTYSIDFEHIVVVVSAFRTNNDIYAFMFLGDVENEDDVKLGQATPVQAAEQALMQAAGQIQPQIFVDGSGFTLVPKASFQEQEFDITYSSGNLTHVGHDGSIVLFPTPGTIENVEFTLTTAVDGVDITLKHTVKLGRPATTKIDEAVATAVGTVVAFEGYLYGGANNTWQFGNPDSAFGAAIRYFQSDLTVGKWYLVIAEKAADFNGLPQMNHIGFVQLEKTDEFVPAKYTGELTSTELAKIKNQIVAIEGLQVSVAPSKDKNGVLTYTLKNGAGQTIAFREHQTKTDYIDAVMALDLKVGDFVNVKSAVVSWFNNPQFILGVLEVAEVSEEQLFDQSVGRFQATLPAEGIKHFEDFNLPIAFENLSIAWAVTTGADAAAVDADGKVTITRLAEETNVVLTGTVTESTFTATVTVTVKVAKEGEEPQEEALLYSIDFEGGTQNGYLRNVETTLQVENGLKWNVVTEATEKSGILWNYNDSQDTNITPAQGANIARIDGRNTTSLVSEAISNVTKMTLDAKFYGTRTDSVLKIFVKGDGDADFVLIQTLELKSTFENFILEINRTNVQIKIEGSGERSNLDNIKIFG